MKIQLDKPMEQLTVRELAWLLAWQASIMKAGGEPTIFAHRDADRAVELLENFRGKK